MNAGLRGVMFASLFTVVSLATVGASTAGATPGAEGAPPPAPATFALIVGVNRSIDPDVAPLRYADDDAARYFDLFQAMGVRSFLLTRFDGHTRTLHPQAVSEARHPTEANFAEVISRLAREVADARRAQRRTTVYFVYAGHGKVREGRGYLTLEDQRLSGERLEAVLMGQLRAGRVHVIADACNSFFLATGRGPGGERRPLRGFTALGGIGARRDVGLLLSTSSERESHEWAGFQAGVFSHEVRSGLWGAADANGDRRISYREIASFVQRANASIANDRFRPEVYARQPHDDEELMDLRPALGHRIEVHAQSAGHHRLEDARGVRLADFHPEAGQPVVLVRPTALGHLYLRSLEQDREYRIGDESDVVRTADLPFTAVASAPRGAVDEAYNLLFSLPFGPDSVGGYRFPDDAALSAPAAPPEEGRRPWALAAGAAGVVTAGVGLVTYFGARRDAGRLSPEASQRQVSDHNRDVSRRALLGGGISLLGAAAGAFGFYLWLSPGGALVSGTF